MRVGRLEGSRLGGLGVEILKGWRPGGLEGWEAGGVGYRRAGVRVEGLEGWRALSLGLHTLALWGCT